MSCRIRRRCPRACRRSGPCRCVALAGGFGVASAGCAGRGLRCRGRLDLGGNERPARGAIRRRGRGRRGSVGGGRGGGWRRRRRRPRHRTGRGLVRHSTDGRRGSRRRRLPSGRPGRPGRGCDRGGWTVRVRPGCHGRGQGAPCARSGGRPGCGRGPAAHRRPRRHRSRRRRCCRPDARRRDTGGAASPEPGWPLARRPCIDARARAWTHANRPRRPADRGTHRTLEA